VHFGLGAARRLREVQIKWPSGIRQVLTDVAANRIVAIEEPKEKESGTVKSGNRENQK